MTIVYLNHNSETKKVFVFMDTSLKWVAKNRQAIPVY